MNLNGPRVLTVGLILFAIGMAIFLALPGPNHEGVEDRRANHPARARAWAKDVGSEALGVSCVPELDRCDVRLSDGRLARLRCGHEACWLDD